MLSKIHAVQKQPQSVDIALLLLRLVVGLAMVLHGQGKIQNPFGWMGPDSAIPGIFLALAAVSEFVGGIALMVGAATKLAAFGIGSTMAVAAYMHAVVFGDPFVSKGGGSYELATIYFFISILFLMNGPGRFSLDRFIFGQK